MTTPSGYRPLNLGDGLRSSCARTPDKVAVEDDRIALSYRDLVARMNRVTSGLLDGEGLAPGTHIAILANNRVEYIEVVAGAAQGGLPIATVNPRLTPSEARVILDDAGARLLFADPDLARAMKDSDQAGGLRILEFGEPYEDWLRQAHPPAEFATVPETDVFTIPYTSGTTGKPKGVLVSHRSRILTLFGMAMEFGCYSPDDRFLAIAPLCHGAGIAFSLASLYFGGYTRILPRFDPERVLRDLSQGGYTGVFMVPTHFHAIFALEDAVLDKYRRHTLGSIISNAAPLPQATKERIVEYFGDGLLHETYGSTEGGVVSNLRPPDQLRKSRCVGLPFAASEIRLLDENGQPVEPGEVGELYSRSPYLFNGYWGLEEETRAALHDGWLTVGDMAQWDDEGYLYIVDRKKDMVISGGINIYPREIEEVLIRHPSVVEAAVIGIPDDRWGERLRAFAVLRPEAALTVEKMQDFLAGKIAKYKIPKELELIDELPKNASGKIMKTTLRSA